MGGNGVYPPHGGGDGFYPPGAPAAPYPPQPGQYPPPSYPPVPYQDRAFELDSPMPPPHYPPMSGGYPPPMYEHDHGHHHHHHHHHSQHDEYPREADPHGSGRRPGLPRPAGQLVKIFSRANTDYNLAVRHDGVVLVPANPHDDSQQWIKDMSWSTRVKDEKGFPAFALINKATNQALKHPAGELQQVLLTDYAPGAIDETTLWTESEVEQGFKAVRMANNIKLNLDAFKGDKKSGGIKDGTPAIVFKWKQQDNQLWKIVPLCKLLHQSLFRSLIPLFDLRNAVMQDFPKNIYFLQLG